MHSPKLLPLALLLGAAIASACDKSKTSEPIIDTTGSDTGGTLFIYTPPPGAPTINSITVPGTFNTWSTTAASMTKQSDGKWQARLHLNNGQYEYKFYINGAWPSDMCHDTVWGDPAHDHWIDPQALGCVSDGFGGENAVVSVGSPSGVGFLHTPTNPAFVSAAGGRLSIRFLVNVGHAERAWVIAGAQSYPMSVQLRYLLQDEWRASVPEATTSYSIAVVTAADSQTFGPFTVRDAVPRAGVGRQGCGVRDLPRAILERGYDERSLHAQHG